MALPNHIELLLRKLDPDDEAALRTYLAQRDDEIVELRRATEIVTIIRDVVDVQRATESTLSELRSDVQTVSRRIIAVAVLAEWLTSGQGKAFALGVVGAVISMLGAVAAYVTGLVPGGG